MKHAAKLQAVAVHAELAQLVELEADVDPLDALLLCVRISYFEVGWYTQKIAQLRPEDVVVRPLHQAMGGKDAIVEDLKEREQLNLWIQAREKAVSNLARYSKMAIDAGIDERRVRAEEHYADAIASVISGFMNDLKLTPEQEEQAPQIVAKHLRLLTGGAA